jgi:hypothetical protein
MVLIAAAAAFIGGYFLSSTNCDIEASFIADADAFKVEYVDYRPPKVTGATIFILPPTGGETPLDRRYAKGLCRDGRRVLVVKKWTGYDEASLDLELHNRLFGKGNRALALLATHHPGPLHLLGTSVGALFSISALARIPQVTKAALVVGGVPFTEIIATSDTEHMNYLREQRKLKFGISSQEDYISRLNAVFEWNDLDKLNGNILVDKKILLVIGTMDQGVPTKNQLQLQERFPMAKVIRHDSDHMGTIVKSFLFDYYQIKAFLK